MDVYSNQNFRRDIYYYGAFRRDFPVSKVNARRVGPFQISVTASFRALLFTIHHRKGNDGKAMVSVLK
jgi:hypothetical protein